MSTIDTFWRGTVTAATAAAFVGMAACGTARAPAQTINEPEPSAPGSHGAGVPQCPRVIDRERVGGPWITTDQQCPNRWWEERPHPGQP